MLDGKTKKEISKQLYAFAKASSIPSNLTISHLLLLESYKGKPENSASGLQSYSKYANAVR